MERLTKFITPVGMVMTNLNSMKHYMPCVPCRHNAKIKYDSNGNGYTEKFSFCDTCEVKMLFNRLKEYEDLEEQGLLKRFQCKVGDIVFFRDKGRKTILPVTIEEIVISHLSEGKYCVEYYGVFFNKYGELTMSFEFSENDFGKTVFLTKEEAEARLNELEGSEEE